MFRYFMVAHVVEQVVGQLESQVGTNRMPIAGSQDKVEKLLILKK